MIERDNPSHDTVGLPQSQVDILWSRWDGHSFEFVSETTIETHPLDGLMNIIRHGPYRVAGVECLDLGKLVCSGLESAAQSPQSMPHAVFGSSSARPLRPS